MTDAWAAALTRAPGVHVMANGEYRQDFLERIALELGPERLMFGSFSPYNEQASNWRAFAARASRRPPVTSLSVATPNASSASRPGPGDR
jgi:predicted TIM-barrel fold metal-dependent hydrolase